VVQLVKYVQPTDVNYKILTHEESGEVGDSKPMEEIFSGQEFQKDTLCLRLISTRD